ncbi:MAG: ATP synthase F1 subunit gamma [Candidatus Dormibacteria bacterium]|jgi:F-type H+-transporting ATPase subunit gamma|nr:ATP synthase F1 subunit gamma [Chloroflexota bacterium]HBV94917.1 ATP synthase F1 subunit gamma [Chloroflexota bacterium]
MPSLLDLRRRIRTVANTQKITKAMELVAASKLRRAQERMQNARPYADELTGVMAQLMGRTSGYQHPYLAVRPVKRRCLVLVTSDRGLVGGLNSNSIRLALRESPSGGLPVEVVTIGRRGRDTMRRLGRNLIADVSNYGDRPTLGTVLPAIRIAMQRYEQGECDQVDLIYARFLSAGRQEATVQRVLPVEPPADAGQAGADFEYEPDSAEVLDALLPRYVEAQVYRAVLENLASEQAARVIAMHNAEENAGEVIQSLTLTANKARQDSITTELMEVVSGATALEA